MKHGSYLVAWLLLSLVVVDAAEPTAKPVLKITRAKSSFRSIACNAPGAS